MESYYDKSSRWVFDSDGNFLHSKRKSFNPNIERESYFFKNLELDEEEYHRYLYERGTTSLKNENRKEIKL
jgi:hypothetical protein